MTVSYYENLIDAGMSEKTAKKCVALYKEGNTAEMNRIISFYRASLLDKIHTSQKQIDRLDHFLYSVKTNKEL